MILVGIIGFILLYAIFVGIAHSILRIFFNWGKDDAEIGSVFWPIVLLFYVPAKCVSLGLHKLHERSKEEKKKEKAKVDSALGRVRTGRPSTF